jgi:hypothetical protein
MKGNVLLTTQTQRDRTQRYGQREASADACAPHRGYPTRAPAAPPRSVRLSKRSATTKFWNNVCFQKFWGKTLFSMKK